MSVFVIFSVSGGTLFFGGLFLLLIINGITGKAADAVLSFLDNNAIAIAIILGIIVILGTYVGTKLFKKGKTISDEKTVGYAISCFIVLSEAAFALVQYTRAPFAGHYGGVLTTFFHRSCNCII